MRQLPQYAWVVVHALLRTDVLRSELSGYSRVTDNQIWDGGKPTALRWDGTSIHGKVTGTEARIYVVLRGETAETPLFQPRVDVKVARSRKTEAEMLTAFSMVEVHDFRSREPLAEEDAIIESPTHDDVAVAEISSVIPWYTTYVTRAILGSKTVFRTKGNPVR